VKDTNGKISAIVKNIAMIEKFKKISIESIDIKLCPEKQEINIKNVFIERLKFLKIGSISITNGCKVATTQNISAEIDYLLDLMRNVFKHKTVETETSLIKPPTTISTNANTLTETANTNTNVNSPPETTTNKNKIGFFEDLKKRIAESRKKKKDKKLLCMWKEVKILFLRIILLYSVFDL